MSVWDEARIGGRAGNRFALGLWHPMHKFASAAYMPPLYDRRKLQGKARYSYVLNFTLALNEVANNRFAVTQDFLWTDTAASFSVTGFSTLVVPFTLQLYDSQNEVRYNNFPLMAQNAAGIYPASDPSIPAFPSGTTNPFGFPYIQRRITRIPKGAKMLMKLQNTYGPTPFVEGSMNVQLVLGGYH